MFTFLGSIGAIQLAGGLAAKFNGSGLVGGEIYAQVPFLAAVALGAAGTVLIAAHWLPGAGISFARGVNDTPKIAGVLLVAWSAHVEIDYALVAIAMVLGGVLGAVRVAQTMSQKITPTVKRKSGLISRNLHP